MRFTPSSLALALAATSVALSSSVDANGAGALLAYRYGKKTATQRRAEQMFPIDASDVGGAVAVVSGEFDSADSGILQRRRLNRNRLLFGGGARGLASFRRSLQKDDDEDEEEEEVVTCIKPDTCEQSLCNCTGNGGLAYDCAAELYALCNNVTASDGTVFTIRGCVNYADYYYNIYCPFAKCVIDGGTNEECGCQFYSQACELYDSRKYKNDEDHIQNCAADLCCLDKTDDVGRALCFEDAPTSTPSVAPSGPTMSPTNEPTTAEYLAEKPSRSAPDPSPTVTSAQGAPTDAAEKITSSTKNPFLWDVVSAVTFFAAAAGIWLS